MRDSEDGESHTTVPPDRHVILALRKAQVNRSELQSAAMVVSGVRTVVCSVKLTRSPTMILLGAENADHLKFQRTVS